MARHAIFPTQRTFVGEEKIAWRAKLTSAKEANRACVLCVTCLIACPSVGLLIKKILPVSQVQPRHIDMSEGGDARDVTVTSTVPIVCPAGYPNCSVRIPLYILPVGTPQTSWSARLCIPQLVICVVTPSESHSWNVLRGPWGRVQRWQM